MFKGEAKFNKIIFPLIESEKRIHQNFINDGQVGTSKSNSFGIKGKTILTEMVELPFSMLIDHMHLLYVFQYFKTCFFIGLIRKIMDQIIILVKILI